MQDWQIEKVFRALAEMQASGYGNYLPVCIRPILKCWLDDTGYKTVCHSANAAGWGVAGFDEHGDPIIDSDAEAQGYVPVPKELR